MRVSGGFTVVYCPVNGHKWDSLSEEETGGAGLIELFYFLKGSLNQII